MRTRKMRLVSALLAVAMMFVMMPVGAFATSDITAYDVTVSKASTDPNKSALQQALEEAYPNIDFNNVKKLTVTTRGVELHKDDFAFMSGTKVTGTAADRYKYERPSDFVYLANLEEVNLSKATCENDAIPPRAFFCDKNITNKITKIVLPDNLKVIDFAAFCGMTELTYLGTSENLHFPSTLTSMGKSMVNGAKKLTGEVTLPPNLERIGASCFVNSGVSGRVYVNAGINLSQNVNADVQNSKENCGSLFYGTDITYLEFQNGVNKIPDSIASKCFKLKEAVIPNTVTEIGTTAFYLTSLSGTIVIPKAVTKIGNAAFRQEEVTVDKDGTLARTYSDSELLEHIIIENPSVEFERNVFLSKNEKLKLYFTSDSDKIQSYKNLTNGYWYNSKTVILNANEGTIAHDNNGNVTAELDTTTGLYVPTKEGYKFLGWYDGETELEGAAQAGKTYTAHWEAKKRYTVTFDLNGHGDTAPATQTVYEGDKATAPETAPTADGYKFDGWYTDAECTNAFDFSTAIEANTTLYAKWSKALIPVTMKYAVTVEDGTASVKDADGNEVVKAAETIYVEEGQAVTITANDTIADGMTFDRWEVREGDVQLANERSATTTFTMGTKPVKVAAMPATESDDSWDAATIITGVAIGAGAAVLTYHIGTELYAEQVLGKGMAVPKTREDVVLKAWELAGKPAVELNGEPLSEAAQAEKWAVESGLMQNDAEGNFNGAKKMNKLKALRVLDKAQKLNAQ